MVCETLVLPPARENGDAPSRCRPRRREGFFSPFSLFPSRLDASVCPAARRHPNPAASRSSWLSFAPSGDLFFARFLAFGAATRFDSIRSVLALPFPPTRSAPAAASRDGHGTFWGCAEPWAVGPVGAALRGVVFFKFIFIFFKFFISFFFFSGREYCTVPFLNLTINRLFLEPAARFSFWADAFICAIGIVFLRSSGAFVNVLRSWIKQRLAVMEGSWAMGAAVPAPHALLPSAAEFSHG